MIRSVQIIMHFQVFYVDKNSSLLSPFYPVSCIFSPRSLLIGNLEKPINYNCNSCFASSRHESFRIVGQCFATCPAILNYKCSITRQTMPEALSCPSHYFPAMRVLSCHSLLCPDLLCPTMTHRALSSSTFYPSS